MQIVEWFSVLKKYNHNMFSENSLPLKCNIMFHYMYLYIAIAI